MTRPILRNALLVFVLLVVAVFSLDLSFTAVHGQQVSTDLAFWISESGGKYGTAIILVITCFFYTRFIHGTEEKLRAFLFTLIKLLLVIGAFAFINEHLVKHAMKMPRPSHRYILERNTSVFSLDNLYALDDEGKHKMLRQVVDLHPNAFSDVDPLVLEHWLYETGYSFPSGHSFNSFLLAFILSYSLYYSRSKAANAIYLVPLVWAFLVCMSRVMLGVHTKWDVSFGALTGITVAGLLMHFDMLRTNLLHRDHEKKAERKRPVVVE